MKRMLVGIDGSSTALHALRWAAHVAQKTGSELLIVASYVADQSVPLQWEEGHRVARERLEEHWTVPAQQVGVPYRSELVDGNAGPALLAAARSEDAELIVVASRGVGGFPGLLIGSVADYLAHHTDRPLAIVPAASSPDAPQRVVLAVDSSAGAQAATLWLAPLALALGAEVLAATVLQGPDPVDERALRGPWTEPLRRAGIAVQSHVIEDGHPASALLQFAQSERAEAIVAGTRRVHGLRLMRLGGVTMQLLHQSSVPVMVVPPSPDIPQLHTPG
jgi:nucleotide-binding universal stress UspA family protein